MGDVEVPLVDLKAQYGSIRSEIAEAMERVLASQQFVLGCEVEALEDEIASYCSAREAIGCASGSDALLLALMALGVGPGDEVICPTYTFFATAGSISRLGAVPVFADIDPASFNLSAESVLAAARRCRTLRAIVPVHLFGQAAPLDEILELARDLEVPVVEDAAQAIGARDGAGWRVGGRSAIGCFSFFPTKNLGAYGDGGIATTSDETLAQRMRLLRVHGSQPKHHHHLIGLNSRLDALQAAVLRVKLAHLEGWNEARWNNAATYGRLFAELGAAAGPGPVEGLALPVRTPRVPAEPALHTFNQYVIRVPAQARDELRAHLKAHHIDTETYYPVPLHMQECFGKLGYSRGDFPESELAADQTLALPIHPELRHEQLEAVVGSIRAFFP